ncbi:MULTISPECIES: methionine ABC transporter permease [Salinicoccus]|jgi:D-methionine transport system permease protein|uniref:ABC transporter permease subunit n=2 Tax=Salinicoccus TaxID=45669 RepID=A0A0C2HH21_9STAP|nr:MULTISPECIES: ABC transporter permease subunit [Salinicoccus]KIH70939.1 methionine ABC transporter permease [Salinicoccus roseus]MBY8908265.1 ABC transporter permease subunit [Salinicoccus roseus]MCC4721949.1 ABC transporter permease subunit [Salinicoccus sp. RF5]MCG7332937.1 ABC transporter permease subunit [Salinicoccus roseus]MDB0580162.1 ABC transporter permease subunit [Salinicoccus roseus]
MQRLTEIAPLLYRALLETTLMVSISIFFAVLLGLPLGILLYITANPLLFRIKPLNQFLGAVTNVIRSFPFIILIVAIMPIATWLTNSSHGPVFASVALSLAAIPLFARLVETSFNGVNTGVIEASIAGGASLWLIVTDVLIPESKRGITQAITLTIISIVAFSATAGVVGGGGIGDLAIRYGYYRYDTVTMVATVVVLIIIVQLIQLIGDYLSQRQEGN